MRTGLWLAGFITLAFAAASASAQQVIVVDPAGGGDHVAIAPAVAAAADGDIILVRPGSYAGSSDVSIDERTLSIVFEAGSTVSSHSFSITNLRPDQFVVIRGLKGSRAQFSCNECDGTIWFEGVDVFGSRSISSPALAAAECRNIVLSRCNMFGLDGGNGANGTTGLIAVRCQVSAWNCAFGGGKGKGGFHGYNDDAGNGLYGGDCFLFLANTRCFGGFGNGGRGGYGVGLTGNSELVELGSTFVGGDGNPPGQDIWTWGDDTSVEHLEGTPRSHVMSAPNRHGDPMSLVFRGQPGDLVLYPHNLRPAGQYVPSSKGTFVLDPDGLLNFRIGRLPGSGVLNLTVTTPTLPGIEGLAFFGQAWFFDLDGVTLSSPSATFLLDPRY